MASVSRASLEALAHRFHVNLWTRYDLSIAHEIISPTVSFRGTLSDKPTDFEGFKRYVHEIHGAFSDWTHRVDEVYIDGSSVISKLHWSGVHTGEFRGWKATGKTVGYSGVSIFKTKGGLIDEAWVVGDTRLMWDAIMNKAQAFGSV